MAESAWEIWSAPAALTSRKRLLVGRNFTDQAERGFPLIGGRLDYVHARPVAAPVYQRHQHFINLFIWPSGNNSNPAEKSFARQGFNLIRWSGSGLTFWAVSDLNLSELGEFVELVK